MRLKTRLLSVSIMTAVSAMALPASVAWAQSPPATAQQVVRLDIPAGPASASLNALATQADVQLFYPYALVNGRTVPALRGEYSRDEAIRILALAAGLEIAKREGDTYALQDPQGGAAEGGGAEVEALVVTAQKKEEAIQDVPIAISAFTQKSLDAQKLEGGFDLLKAIPNVSFSKSNFSGYNFSIRGIGTKAVSATTDPGVAVAFNNSTLIVNRLFEQEYFDVERVEVLRGPQGTLYGRNATGGVINVLSARPRLGEFDGDVKLEAGNYNARRARGMVNIPIGDSLAFRFAGAFTKRDGYGTNLAATDPEVLNDVRQDVDGRDLWSARVTVGWEPIEQVRVNAMWERFAEDDNRVRTSKQLCHTDPGPAAVGSWIPADELATSGMSQSCKAGSLYDVGAYGTPNGASLPYIGGSYTAIGYASTPFLGNATFGLGGNPYFLNPSAAPCAIAAATPYMYPLNPCNANPYGGVTQTQDLRSIHSTVEPVYRANSDVVELSVDIDFTESLTFTSQTVYAKDTYYASQDFNRYKTVPIFNDSTTACNAVDAGFGVSVTCPGPYAPTAERPNGFYYDLTPGGVYTDPQLGPSKTLVGQDLSRVKSEQFNQEFRLASNFDAPINFSMGANFTRFETYNDYFVFINALSYMTNFFPFNSHKGCYSNEAGVPCLYVDPNPLNSFDGDGHNYFRSANPYELTSSALFGEMYWQVSDTIKATLGARVTWDRKVFTPVPSQLLLWDYRRHVPDGAGPEDCVTADPCQFAGTGVNSGEGARGSPANPDIVQEWREPTGRLIVDWKPDLAFTDETMVYVSLAHGYKGGGANPPNIAPPAGIFNARNSGGVNPPTFEPEYIDALEVGTKNTLLNGALILNTSAFYYDYAGYQVSKIVDRSAYNENFDATVAGVEVEWIFSPMRNLRFNGTLGHLRTKIADGESSIDLMDRAAGGKVSYGGYDEWMVLKPWVVSSSNCIAPVELVEMVVQSSGYGVFALCPGGNVVGHTYFNPGGTEAGRFHALPNGEFYTQAPNGGAGFSKDLGGNDLPNAPHWTASLGAQYTLALPGGWDGTLRGDFYWQSQSFARVYNSQYDKLRAWTNANISLWFEQADWGVTAEVYVKNVFDESPITDAFLNSDDSGLTTNVFTLDPRLIGVSVRKSF